MATFAELKAQAQALEAEIEAARKAELADVLAKVRGLVAEFNLTEAQVFSGATLKIKAPKPAQVVKYRGPNGETWGGGAGRKPFWVLDVITSGGDIEQYRV